jgi:hypothetical protein
MNVTNIYTCQVVGDDIPHDHVLVYTQPFTFIDPSHNLSKTCQNVFSVFRQACSTPKFDF